MPHAKAISKRKAEVGLQALSRQALSRQPEPDAISDRQLSPYFEAIVRTWALGAGAGGILEGVNTLSEVCFHTGVQVCASGAPSQTRHTPSSRRPCAVDRRTLALIALAMVSRDADGSAVRHAERVAEHGCAPAPLSRSARRGSRHVDVGLHG